MPVPLRSADTMAGDSMARAGPHISPRYSRSCFHSKRAHKSCSAMQHKHVRAEVSAAWLYTFKLLMNRGAAVALRG